MAIFANPIKLSTVPYKAELTGSAVNGGDDIFLAEIEDIERSYDFMQAGGYCKTVTTASDYKGCIKELHKSWAALQKRFDQILVIPDNHYFDNGDTMILLNWIEIKPGCFYYYIKDCLHHRRDVRRAILSGLWLMSGRRFMNEKRAKRPQTIGMGFDLAEDTHEYENFINESDEWIEEMAEDEKPEFEALVKFHKSKPCLKAVKFYSREFHRYAKRTNSLGDWLRLLWHYRNYNWHGHIPYQIKDDDSIDPVDISLTRGIFYQPDLLVRRTFDTVDCYWNEGGLLGLADYQILSKTKVLKPLENLDIKTLSRDFAKIWEFNIKTLKYRSNYAYGTYNYKARRFPPHRSNDNLHGKGGKGLHEKGKAVRRIGADRRRRTHRSRAAA